MKYTRLHETAEGISRFEDIELEMTPGGAASHLSTMIAATGAVFSTLPAGYVRDWHPAPHRQFIITLAGAGEITAGDGSTRRFGAGDILLVEDTAGRGHVTRNDGDGPWRQLWVTLAEVAPFVRGEGAPPSASYLRVYALPDGSSTFEEVAVALTPTTSTAARSEIIPATGIIFRRTSPEYSLDYHNAPRRQFVVTLTGAVEIVSSDGQTRRLGPGSVLLAEDTTGKGHISRDAGGIERLSVFVPLTG